MPRKRDVPCSGGCGTLVWRGPGCLPPGQSTCNACRRLPRPRTCSGCGKMFLSAMGAGRYRRRTCSDSCKTRAVARGGTLGGAKGIGQRRTPPRVCDVCAEPYRPTYQAQRTCSRTCGVQINAYVLRARERATQLALALPPEPHPCSECAEPTTRVVCSEHCQRTRSSRLAKAARRAVQRNCARCATGLGEDRLGRANCKACSEELRRAERRRTRSRRKARKRGVAHEPYTLAEIAARDKYACGICRKRVLMNKAVPHAKAPTIDHLVPISDGGPDTPANVQLAHFICNSLRGAGGTVQLALIG